MNPRSRAEALRATWMILGLFAIPVISVSSAALLADVASSTDPATAAVGIPAMFGGLVMGALVFRLARVMHSGAVAVRAVLVAAYATARRVVAEGVRPVAFAVEQRPAFVLIPARVGRRGPPARSS